MKKIIASMALLAAVAGIAGLGTFATFTSSTSASNSESSGVVDISVGTAGTAQNRLTVGATKIVPGDTIQRAVTLTNNGTGANSDTLASITLTTNATTSSLLDTDATNGLQVVIDKCSVPWTEAGTAPAYTYTCSGGTTSSVLASRAVIGSNVALSNLASVAPGSTDNLRVTLTFPAAADNTFQNKSSVINFTFTGTQRNATSK
jgi:spore coat-associated protein N